MDIRCETAVVSHFTAGRRRLSKVDIQTVNSAAPQRRMSVVLAWVDRGRPFVLLVRGRIR